MLKYVVRYTFGKKNESSVNLGISCPVCGSSKLVKMGKLPKIGYGFRCQICDEIFYVNIIGIDPARARRNKQKVIDTTVTSE